MTNCDGFTGRIEALQLDLRRTDPRSCRRMARAITGDRAARCINNLLRPSRYGEFEVPLSALCPHSQCRTSSPRGRLWQDPGRLFPCAKKGNGIYVTRAR